MSRLALRPALRNYAHGQPLAEEGFENTVSVVFSGTTENVVSSQIADAVMAAACSAAMWIKPDTTVGWEYLWKLGTGGPGAQTHFKFMLRNVNTAWNAYCGDGDGTAVYFTVGTAATNAWHFIVFTDTSTSSSAGTAKMYIDGALIDTVTSPAWAGSGITVIQELAFWTLAGNIDEPTIWNRELTLAEIVALYGGGAPIDPTTLSAGGPVHWWRMGDANGSSGVTVEDQVGSADMTLVNSPAYSSDVPT